MTIRGDRSTRACHIDRTHPLRTADGNLRGDLPGKLGLKFDALKGINPKLVCAHLSAYGQEGSRGTWPGYDYLMQAEAGHLSLTGEPDGPPTRYGLSVVDLMTGLAADPHGDNGSATGLATRLGPRLRVALKLRRNDATRGDVGFKKSSRDRNFHRTPCD
jgi:hypothetical protein